MVTKHSNLIPENIKSKVKHIVLSVMLFSLSRCLDFHVPYASAPEITFSANPGSRTYNVKFFDCIVFLVSAATFYVTFITYRKRRVFYLGTGGRCSPTCLPHRGFEDLWRVSLSQV